MFRNAYSIVHLDDKSNTDVKGNTIVWDSSPAATFGPGKFGNALMTGQCRVKMPTETNQGNPFTIACWVKSSNRSSSGSDNCSVRVNPNNEPGMLCHIGFNVNYNGAGTVRLLLGNNSTWLESNYLLGNIPIDSNWHHFAFTYKNGSISTFIDGVRTRGIPVGLASMSNFSQFGIMSGSVSQIDEVIYTPDILYTENFNVPTRPY